MPVVCSLAVNVFVAGVFKTKMGLCKCSRRRVTNLFCFEHNVSVCEHCIVAEHPACVIKSYLHWLDDSDYDPTCPFPWCRRILKDAECARLICYHVFHWNCLNKHFTQDLPANTAPAGYQCPLCKRCVFPEPNNASPVADALRKKLETVDWGRSGLSAGAVESHAPPNNELPHDEHQNLMADQHFKIHNSDRIDPYHGDSAVDNGLPHLSGQSVARAADNSYRKDAAINFSTHYDGSSNTSDTQLLLPPLSDDPNNSGKILSKHRHHNEPYGQFHSEHNDGTSDYDADAEKYSRRSFLNQFSRLFKNRFVISRRRIRGGPICKYVCFVLVIGLIVLLTGSLLFTGVMRRDGGAHSAAGVVEIPGHHDTADSEYAHAVQHHPRENGGRQRFAAPEAAEFDGNNNNIEE